MSIVLTPDICIIGAGSAGLTLAAIAAGFDVPVVLIERDKMGGDCLNVGCVPSKALLAAGKAAHHARKASSFGVHLDEPDIHFDEVHAHVHHVIRHIAPHDSAERFRAMGVNIIKGEACFRDKKTIAVGSTLIRARRFVIATGSRPFIPPIEGLSETPFMTNETLFNLQEKPDHLLILGGGAIGAEMAQAHRRLGSEVTLIEAGEILGREDLEAAAVIRQSLEEEGVHILNQAQVSKVSHKDRVFTLDYEHKGEKKDISGTHLLIATGRQPNIESLALDKANVKTTHKAIKVSSSMRTTNRHIYAVGDVTGGHQFTHSAGYEASLVARALLFRLPIQNKPHIIARTTYTEPELASIGLTEKEALTHYKNTQILRWSFHENDRAQSEKKANGFIKVFTTKRGKILGAVLVGPQAGELISMWGLAISKGMSVKDIAGWVAPYPTLTEVNKRASVEFFRPTLSNPLLRKMIQFLRRFG